MRSTVRSLWLKRVSSLWVNTVRSKHNRRRSRFTPPGLEILESRLALTAQVSTSWSTQTNTLTIELPNDESAPVTLTVNYCGIGLSISLTGTTFAPATGFAYTLNGNTLTSSSMFENLTILEAETTATHDVDTVILANVLLGTEGNDYNGIDTVGALTVNAGLITFGSNNSTYNISGVPEGNPAVFFSYSQNTNVIAGSVSLTSWNSMAFGRTPLPFAGTVSLNTVPSGQAYATDVYVSGPDWAGLGYKQNDYITFNTAGYCPWDTNGNAVTSNNFVANGDTGKPEIAASSGPYEIAGIAGNNMYLKGAAGSITAGTNDDFTLQYYNPNYGPIQTNNLTLKTTGPGSSITGAFTGYPLYDESFQTSQLLPESGGSVGLSATTNDGPITITNSPYVTYFNPLLLESSHPDQVYNGYETLRSVANLTLGSIDAGLGTVSIAAGGSIYSGYDADSGNDLYITASAVNLTSTNSYVAQFVGYGMAQSMGGYVGPVGTVGSVFQAPGWINSASGSSIAVNTKASTPVTSLAVTAATLWGTIDITDFSNAGITVNSISAYQEGQAPTVTSDNVQYNSTPASSATSTTFSTGDCYVILNSTGPITVNSINATGSVDITGEFIVQGTDPQANITTPQLSLVALGYQDVNCGYYWGSVTFARGTNGCNDSLQFTATPQVLRAGQAITITGASQASNNGTFTILSITDNIYTLTCSGVVTTGTDPGLSVGTGASYQGTFTVGQSTNTNNAVCATLTLPSAILNGVAPPTWADYNFVGAGAIFISGAKQRANNGIFAITSMSSDEYTIVLDSAYNLIPDVEYATVGNNNIGQPSAPVSFTNVPNFSAYTADGSIFLNQKGSITSVASYVNAGAPTSTFVTSPPLTTASVTSNAQLLGIEHITATGVASVTMSNGMMVDGTAFGSNDAAFLITAPAVSLASPYDIGTSVTPFLIAATTSISVNSTATTRNGGGVYLNNLSGTAVNAFNVSTYDSNVTIQTLSPSSTTPIQSLTFASHNNVLAEVGTASVSFANTYDQGGLYGDVIVGSTLYANSISAGIGSSGTIGAGLIFTNAAGTINGSLTTQGTPIPLSLSAASGIGTQTYPLTLTNVTAVNANTASGPISILATNTSSAPQAFTITAQTGNGGITINSAPNSSTIPLTLSAATPNGNIAVDWAGPIQLAAPTSRFGVNHNSLSTAGSVTLTAAGNIGPIGTAAISASSLNLTATMGSIGSASLPLQVTAPATLLLNASANSVYLTSNTSLTVGSIQTTPSGVLATTGEIVLSATGDVTLQGLVQSPASISLTANGGYVSQTSAGLLQAPSLTIAADGIGWSTPIQTGATTIKAAADYGGIYLNNTSSQQLNLTVSAIGTASVAGALSTSTTNDITIASRGPIFLQPQSTALTQEATSLPVAIFNPGGNLILTSQAVPLTGTQTITSAVVQATATTMLNTAGGVGALTTTNRGVGYLSAPLVTFLGGGGIGATATATATGGAIAVPLVHSGSGYLSPPSVIIAPPAYDIYTGSYSVNGNSKTPYPGLIVFGGAPELPATTPETTAALISLQDLQWNGTGTAPTLSGGGTVTCTTPSPGNFLLTIQADAITIGNLGLNGRPGIAILGSSGLETPSGNWSLRLISNIGPVVFLNLSDTIVASGTGTLSIAANGEGSTILGPAVAALGNLTTAGGNISVSAIDNIAIGNMIAGIASLGSSGALTVTSATGSISRNPSASSLVGSSVTFTEADGLDGSTHNAALAQLQATQAIAAANAAYSKAIAMEYAAGAAVAAELATFKAFQVLVPALEASYASDKNEHALKQVAVTTANTNYQTALSTAQGMAATVAQQLKTVAALDVTEMTLTNAGLITSIRGEILSHKMKPSEFGDVLTAPGAAEFINAGGGISLIGTVVEQIGASFGLSSAIADVILAGNEQILDEDIINLITSENTLATAQSAEVFAAARVKSSRLTLSSLTASKNIAQQAYTVSQQALTQAKANTVNVESQGLSSQAIAIAGVIFNSPPQPINVVHSIFSGAGLPAVPFAINYASVSPSGAVIRSDISAAVPIAITATNNLVVPTNVAISANGNPITITAGRTQTGRGTSVTIAGLLRGSSASIGVGPGVTGGEVFNITPSPATPITVTGSGSGNTLNFAGKGLSWTVVNNQGGSVTLKDSTGALASVTFSNIQAVRLLDGGSSLMVQGMAGLPNTVNLVGTGPRAGTLDLQGVTYSFSATTGLTYLGTGQGDVVTVTPFVPSGASSGTGSAQTAAWGVLPWNLTVSISGGTGTPAKLIYNAPDPYVDVVATGNWIGNIVDPGAANLFFSNVNQATVVYNKTATVISLPTLAINAPGGTYSGKPYTATAVVSGPPSTSKVKPKITYFNGSLVLPQAKLRSAPVNAGTYTVVSTFRGISTPAATWASETQSASLTIRQASQTINFKLPKNSIPFVPQTTLLLTGTSSSGLPLTYTIDPQSTPNAASISGNVLTILGVGTIVIDANQAGNNNIGAAVQAQQTLVVYPVASKLVLQNPSSGPAATGGMAGVALPPVNVWITDQWGNLVTTSTASVTVKPSVGSFAPASTLTVIAVNGVAAFNNLILTKAGALTVTASSTGLASATTRSFTITPAAASKVLVGTKASLGTTVPVPTATAGSTLATIYAVITDQYNNQIKAGPSSTASVSLTPSLGSFTSTSITTVQAVNGLATFSSLVLTTAGSVTLTAASNGLASGTSTSGTIVAAAASQVVWNTPPSTAIFAATAGSLLPQISALIEDRYGNVVTTGTASTAQVKVSASIGSFTAGSTTTVSAVKGVATFSNLILVTVGSTTLTATSAGLTPCISTAGTIAAPAS